MAKQINTNAGKVKLTHVHTGKSFFKDPEVAKAIMDHPRFKGAYKSEALANVPQEIAGNKADKSETSGAAADQQADETK